MFLNRIQYPGIGPHSKLKRGTVLRVPKPNDDSNEMALPGDGADGGGSGGASSVRYDFSTGRVAEASGAASGDGDDESPWYTAAENDTPRSIAAKLQLQGESEGEGGAAAGAGGQY